jgi:hypothetical protein
VLLPLDQEHDALYRATIEPALARRMVPSRLDRLAESGVIFDHFTSAADGASAVVVDITRLNENVMYEIGLHTDGD